MSHAMSEDGNELDDVLRAFEKQQSDLQAAHQDISRLQQAVRSYKA